VKQVLSIAKRNIAPPPASISNGVDGQFVSGFGKVEDGKRMIFCWMWQRTHSRRASELAALAGTLRPAWKWREGHLKSASQFKAERQTLTL